VPQGDLPDIQRYFGAGKPLAVQALASEGPGSTLDGTLAFVDNAVDSTTGTVLLKAKFENSKSTLWPGQFVDVTLRLYIDPNALTVPSAAVLTGQNGAYVFTVDNAGNAHQQPVQVVRTADTLSVIGTGLREGDRVITDGQSRLVAGSKVIIRPASAAGATPRIADSGAAGAANPYAPSGSPSTAGQPAGTAGPGSGSSKPGHGP
jgi:multidrug efflux system membrane fusion protein